MNLVPAGLVSSSSIDRGLPTLRGNYRLAATFSMSFWDGLEGRIFYHNQAADGSYYIQEIIWKQSSNTYTYGSILLDVIPGSRLAVSINEASRTLHLFYSTKNLTLQEEHLDISDPGASYQKGRVSRLKEATPLCLY